ncbi:UDP-glucose 4-epimerase GalE [Citreimonas salinaria]|uniref:UDP-glucose 4-epimerase n=1 Tax=Citreimonas salinaria TaxID=321339 RepID=A0A1H3N5F5_9RHOB|nr:UDP-glucose 4-epimerase GalE [Citreimonas salinaria]SDY83449.1 UDP-glucose 4-epimerase [Citreimonas salinaria]
MRERILLTGGAGFIGSHTYVEFVEAGYEVWILDNFENASIDVPDRIESLIGEKVHVIHCDLRNVDSIRSVMASGCFDAVVHFAARKSVPESESNPGDYFRSNVIGLVNLVEAMRGANVTNLVFSSSAAVYGAPSTVPISEADPPAPLNAYAETKRVGEDFIRCVARAHPEMRFGVLRYFNPVGAHPSGIIGEAPSQPPGNLVPVLARVASGQLDELLIFGGDYPTKDGTAIRDYIHVMDLARGHVLSLKALLRERTSHVVNLGTGRGYSVLEVLGAYSRAVGHSLRYRIVDRRIGDAAVSFADTRQARRVLGFEAQHGLSEMCRSSWRFYSKEAGVDVAAPKTSDRSLVRPTNCSKVSRIGEKVL